MEAPKLSWAKRAGSWLGERLKTPLEFAETALVVLYIFTCVATSLLLFDLVEASSKFRHFVGAVAFGFGIFAFIAYINRGVKHQHNSKRGRK